MRVGFFKVHDYTKKSNICEIWKNWANIGVFMFVKWFIIIGCICIKGNSDQHIRKGKMEAPDRAPTAKSRRVRAVMTNEKQQNTDKLLIWL